MCTYTAHSYSICRCFCIIVLNSSRLVITVSSIAVVVCVLYPGPYGLPSWLLRDLAPLPSQPLAAIFNASLREGYLPPIWKSA